MLGLGLKSYSEHWVPWLQISYRHTLLSLHMANVHLARCPRHHLALLADGIKKKNNLKNMLSVYCWLWKQNLTKTGKILWLLTLHLYWRCNTLISQVWNNIFCIVRRFLDVTLSQFLSCRRVRIARHFGELWDAEQCVAMCDHCDPKTQSKQLLSYLFVLPFRTKGKNSHRWPRHKRENENV